MDTPKTNRIQDLLKSLGQIHGDVSVSDANHAIRRPVSHNGDHQPKLLWDLLLYTLQFLRRADVSSFVLTCRTAYEHGVPFLARRYGFDVGREPEVMSLTRFCSFMLGSPLRPHFLRELCISAGYIDVLDGAALVPQQVQCIMEALAEVIRQAVNLEVLHIPLLHPQPYINPQKDFSPYILPSLGSLTKLREFVLSDPGETGLSVLENIRSPLRKVVLGLYYPPFEDMGRGEINILPHVAQFAGSLEVLELEYACSGAMSFKSNGIQFQHAHTLTLRYKTPKIIGLRLDDLFAAFPSLRVLELPVNTYWAEIEDPDEEYSDQELEAQRVIQRRRRANRWSSFDSLICPIRWAYGAVPPKANTWQRFELGASDMENWDRTQRGYVARDETNINREIAQFHALLEDIRPVHLDLMTYAYVTQMPNWLPSLGVVGLTHLNLELFWTHRLYCESGENWLRNLLDTCLSGINAFPDLTFLGIRISDEEHWASERLAAVNTSVKAFDTWAFVASLAETLLNLTHVAIRFRGEEQEDVCWRVTRGSLDKGDSGGISGRKLSKTETLQLKRDSPFSAEAWVVYSLDFS